MELAVSGDGQVRVASLTLLDNSGVEDCVGLRFVANTSDGWLVLSQASALELAAKLMVMAGDA